MARRRRRSENRVHTGKFLAFIVGVVVFASIIKSAADAFRSLEPLGKGLALALIACTGIAVYLALTLRQARNLEVARDAAKARTAIYDTKLTSIKLIVDEHIHTLIAQKNLKTSHDVYGNADESSWKDEMDHFIQSTVARRISEVVAYRSEIIRTIEESIALKAATPNGGLQGYVTDNGHEFEQECLEAFRNHGWTGYRTKGSGDQGADIIIRKNGIAVAVQCKLYTNKVGNAAVQQIHAARAIYKSDYAAVITNSSFTPSAYQAAKHTNVFLIVTGGEEELDRLIAEKR